MLRRYVCLMLCLGGAAWGQITLSATRVSLGTYVHGQTVPPAVLSITASEPWKATAGATWLTVSPQSGQASLTTKAVTLTVATANLPVRQNEQSTTLVFASTRTTGSPAPPVTVNVTITHKPVLTVSKTGFAYNCLPGQTPPVDSFAITANDPNNDLWTITPAATTPRGGTWLSVSARAGRGSLDTVIVLINTAGLAVGSYTGTITVTPGAPGAPLALPVSLAITSGVPNVVLSSPFFVEGTGLRFAGVTPPAQSFTLLNTGGSEFNWSAAVETAGGGNWLLASPKSGNTAATVTVAVNGAGLSAGTYNGGIRINVPQAVTPVLAVPVSYTISPNVPIIAPSGVVHAATFLPGPISPGQLITIFGSNLANGVLAATPAEGALPTALGITSVTIGETAAPLIFVSPTQINAQAPFELAGQTAQVVVNLGEMASQPAVVGVAPAAPGIFSQSGTGLGSATVLKNSDFSLVTADNPARPGETVAIFCTGLGQVEGGGVTGMAPGAPAAASVPIAVNFGTTGAAVRYAGVAIGFVGLYQVNVTVPAVTGRGGAVPVTVRTIASSSPALNTFVAATAGAR